MGRLTAGTGRHQAEAWADRTCEEQALPAKISDRATLAAVAALLGVERLDAPERREALRVEEVATSDGGTHRHTVEYSRDNGMLPGKRQRRPGSAQPAPVTEEAVKG
jgi:hypothetical protein